MLTCKQILKPGVVQDVLPTVIFFFPLNQAGALILFLSLIMEILKLVCSFSPFLTHFQQENRSQDKRLMLV